MKAAGDTKVTEAGPDSALGALLVALLKGVVYQRVDAIRWGQLLALQARVRDYAAVIGLQLMLDEAEGYAYLRSRPEQDDDAGQGADAVPRLMVRRQLSFPVSLLLALLRKKLAEFDAGGGDTRLVLTRDELVELMRVFLPDSSNEAKLVDQIERHANKVVELGFLRRLKPVSTSAPPSYEVRRIVQAFVDAQWLDAFDQRLEQYRRHALGLDGDEGAQA